MLDLKLNCFGVCYKCESLKDKVDYLGYEVSATEIHTSLDKVNGILGWPQIMHGIRPFLGLVSYYHKFI